MENLVQREIIQAVIKAKNRGEDIKPTIKALAKEFSLTEFMVRGIIENSAMYGLERISGPKQESKKWQPLDYTRAIKKLEDKIYELRAEVVKLHNRLNRELRITENPSTRRGLSSFEAEEEPLELREHEEIPRRQILLKAHENIEPEKRERIEELRETIDRARSRLDKKEEEGPRLIFRGLEEVGKVQK